MEHAHPISQKLKENEFKYLSMMSWSVMITQIIKLFYISRITLYKFKGMALDDELAHIPRTYLNNSTIYSSSEVILLKWIEGVNTMVRKERRQFINFDTELRNGLSYASILHLYSDNSARPLRLMKDQGLTEDDLRINMAALRESMVELNLNYVPSSAIISQMNNLQGMLLSAHLFLVMPYYMPKEVVEFQCILNDTVIKKILLHNPSQKRIGYSVTLEGSGDFRNF